MAALLRAGAVARQLRRLNLRRSSSSGTGGDDEGRRPPSLDDEDVTRPMEKVDKRSLSSDKRKRTVIPERILNYRGRVPEGFIRGTKVGNITIPQDKYAWMTPDVVDAFTSQVLLGGLQISKEEKAKKKEEDLAIAFERMNKTGQWGSQPPLDEDDEGPGAPEDMSYLTKNRPQGRTIEAEDYDFMNNEHARDRPHELEDMYDNESSDKPRCDKKKKFHLVLPEHLDVSNLPVIKEFLNDAGMIEKRKQTRLCAKCQRKVARLIKRGRQMGHIPYNSNFEVHNVIGFPDAQHKANICSSI